MVNALCACIAACSDKFKLMTDDGWFLCSGVIDTRSDEVKVALEKAGMTAIEKYEQNGWVSFRARKK